MHALQAAQLRRQAIDWRDRWVSDVPKRLEEELKGLFSSIDSVIDKMTAWQLIYKTGWVLSKEIQPIYKSWVKDKAGLLMTEALDSLKLVNKPLMGSTVAGGTISDTQISLMEYLESGFVSAGSLAGIAGIAVMTTIKIGGVLGFFATTILTWPIAVVGILAVLLSKKVADSLVGSFKERLASKLKDKVRSQIRDRVLLPKDSSGDVKANKSHVSVASSIQDNITKMCNTYLEELKNA